MFHIMGIYTQLTLNIEIYSVTINRNKNSHLNQKINLNKISIFIKIKSLAHTLCPVREH